MTDSSGERGNSGGLLTYRCDTCGQPVTPGSGYIHIDKQAAMSALAWKRPPLPPVVRASDIPCGPPQPSWEVHHGVCDPHPDRDDSWYAIERVDTYPKLLAHAAHMSTKLWFPYTRWDQLVYRILDTNGATHSSGDTSTGSA